MTLTPAQKKAQAAFLKKKGMTLQQWHNQTASAWAKSHPEKQPRKGVVTTANDVLKLRNSLFNPDKEYAAALDEATRSGNVKLEGLPDQTKLENDAGQRSENIKRFENNLFTQLGQVQVANANANNQGIGLFNQGADAADKSANAQVIAAGGVAAPSTAPNAAASLGVTAAANNNVFGARQAGASQQQLLDQRQNQNDLTQSIYDLNQNKDKIQQQAAADAISIFQHRRDLVENNLPNYLNYSLYNTNDAAKNAVAKTNAKTAQESLKLRREQFNSDADYKNATLDIRREANRLRAQGLDDARVSKLTKAYEDILVHGSGKAGTSGGIKYKVIVRYQAPDTYDNAGRLIPGGIQRKTLTVDAGHYNQFLNSGDPKGNGRDTSLLGGGTPKGAATIGKAVQIVGSGSAGSKPWSAFQKYQHLKNAGYGEKQARGLSGYKG